MYKAIVQRGSILSRIVTPLPLAIKSQLYNDLSYEVPGSFFAIQKTRRSFQWDGIKRLFQLKTQSFLSGLLERVTQVLRGFDYEVEIQESISLTNYKPIEFYGELRDYQKEDLEKILVNRRGVIQSPTGSGKSVLINAIIAAQGLFPTVIFVYTKETLYQMRDFCKLFLRIEPTLVGDGNFEISDVNVMMVQTAERRIRNRDISFIKFLGEVKSAHIDETHHCPTQTVYAIIKELSGVERKYGYSATPWRESNDDLLIEGLVGEKIVVHSIKEMIDKGFLVPPTVFIFDIDEYTSGISRIKGEDFSKTYKKYPEIFENWVTKNDYRNLIIMKIVKKLKEYPVLILTTRVEHVKRLAQLLSLDEEGSCGLLLGEDDSSVRQSVLSDLKSGKLKYVVATQLADEGLDIQCLRGIVLAAPGISSVKTYQRIGRALRPDEGKTGVVVIDFCDKVKYLQRQFRERERTYLSEPAFRVVRGTIKDLDG